MSGMLVRRESERLGATSGLPVPGSTNSEEPAPAQARSPSGAGKIQLTRPIAEASRIRPHRAVPRPSASLLEADRRASNAPPGSDDRPGLYRMVASQLLVSRSRSSSRPYRFM